jgi:hypothetical protein
MTKKVKEALTLVRDMSTKVDKEQTETHEFLNKMFLLLLEIDPPQEKEIVYVPQYWRDWWVPHKVWYGGQVDAISKTYRVGDLPDRPFNSNTPTMQFKLDTDGIGDFISLQSTVSGDK